MGKLNQYTDEEIDKFIVPKIKAFFWFKMEIYPGTKAILKVR